MQHCLTSRSTTCTAARGAARWRSSLPAPSSCSVARRVAVRSAEPAVAAPAAAIPSADIASQLTPQQQQEWVACVERLQQLGFSAEESDKTITRAMGWSSQVYWLKDKVNQPAELSQVEAVLGYLQSMGMTDEQLAKVVKLFPEVVGVDVDKVVKAAFTKLEKEWKMTGDVAVRAVLRKPQILGYTIDCVGDCAGVCARCWARF